MTILDEIFLHKRAEVAQRKALCPLEELRAAAEAALPPLDFLGVLQAHPVSGPALIAEIKRGSPSRGLLARDFDPLRLSRLYRQNGASAISVLTDERFFGGCLEHLALVVDDRQSGPGKTLPVLRKDFIFDPYQVYEARAAGADALLLIAAALEVEQMRSLYALTRSLGMAPLVEVHTPEELAGALALDPVLIGINNRNLRDFTVDLECTLRLGPAVPPDVVLVAESGIHTTRDVERLAEAGVDAILVGEALVTAEDPAARVRAFSGLARAGQQG
jgi:indole-3-glycerol phosphate synthase